MSSLVMIQNSTLQVFATMITFIIWDTVVSSSGLTGIALQSDGMTFKNIDTITHVYNVDYAIRVNTNGTAGSYTFNWYLNVTRPGGSFFPIGNAVAPNVDPLVGNQALAASAVVQLYPNDYFKCAIYDTSRPPAAASILARKLSGSQSVVNGLVTKVAITRLD